MIIMIKNNLHRKRKSPCKLQIYSNSSQKYPGRNCYNLMSWQCESLRCDAQARWYALKELTNGTILASADWTLSCDFFMRYSLTFLWFFRPKYYHSFGHNFVLLKLCSNLIASAIAKKICLLQQSYICWLLRWKLNKSSFF